MKAISIGGKQYRISSMTMNELRRFGAIYAAWNETTDFSAKMKTLDDVAALIVGVLQRNGADVTIEAMHDLEIADLLGIFLAISEIGPSVKLPGTN